MKKNYYIFNKYARDAAFKTTQSRTEKIFLIYHHSS